MFGHIIEAQSQFVSFREASRVGNLSLPFEVELAQLKRPGDDMPLFRETFLLFSLNLLDAMLTIVWVRNGVATESNQLMARLLDNGDLAFLSAKIAIGTINRTLARYGLTLTLAVYLSLMGIHVVTGLSAFGYISKTALADLESLTTGLLAMVM